VSRILTLIALISALAVAACGSSDDKKADTAGKPATTGSGNLVQTTTTKSGKVQTTTTKIAPGKVAPVQARTPQERTFVANLNKRCIATIGSARSIAAPGSTVTAARTYARSATGTIKRTVAVLKASHPPKNQVVAVASLLGSYGQTVALLKTLEATKGPKTEDAKNAAQNLAPTLKRVRTFAKAAALPSCRPPGL
jgi:porphobilinogen deaminase